MCVHRISPYCALSALCALAYTREWHMFRRISCQNNKIGCMKIYFDYQSYRLMVVAYSQRNLCDTYVGTFDSLVFSFFK